MIVIGNDYYLIAHNDRSGRTQTHPQVVALGLAASLLAELMILGYVTVHEGGLHVVPGNFEPPACELQREVLAALHSRPAEHDLGQWLDLLAAEALVDVAKRLAREGILVAVEKRGLLRGNQTSYQPRDVNQAVWPSIRLANTLMQPATLDVADAVLTVLIQCTGLMPRVLWDKESGHDVALATVESLMQQVPPAIAALAHRTEAAAGSVVLTRR